MATFLPQQAPSAPLPDFAPTSPPDRQIFYPNGAVQHPATSADRNGPQMHHRPSMDLQRMSATGPIMNGAVPMSNPPHVNIANGASQHRNTMSLGAFDGPRSPPNTKNTSHVPCKFFRSGQCQAGKACPFSHSTDAASADQVCRYFQKGNCKFGQKCALAHILPNGRRVNRPNGPAKGTLDLGGRLDPQLYRQSDPALARSLLAQQANGTPAPFINQIPQYAESDYANLHNNPSHQQYDIPSIDADYASHPGSNYGSPREDTRPALSPNANLSVLDAPLPASFDSQGISYMARHGPVAASVPSKFGLEFSPPSSTPRKSAIPLDSVRNLQSSTFAGRETQPRGPDLGSSPLGSGDEGFGQRFMHSRKVTKPKMLSASLPRAGMCTTDEWDDTFQFSEGEETDYIPTSLHDQILTPQEKMRRLSRHDQDSRPARDSLSGIGTPGESSSNVGSPGTGSPSRYNALFARQQQQQQQDANSPATGSPKSFGAVGSPYSPHRNSSLNPRASPSLRAIKDGSELSPSFPSISSPPRQSSMSILSQQLSRSRISTKTSESTENSNITNTAGNNSLHSISTRHSSAPTNSLNRAVSSSSISNGRIEEEHGENIFSMEEEEEDPLNRRWNGDGWEYGALGGEKQSPKPRAIGSGRGIDIP